MLGYTNADGKSEDFNHVHGKLSKLFQHCCGPLLHVTMVIWEELLIWGCMAGHLNPPATSTVQLNINLHDGYSSVGLDLQPVCFDINEEQY